MANPDLEQLAANVSNAVKAYNDALDLEGARSRTQIRSTVRQLMLKTMTPEDYCWDQIGHMTEIVALRICMKLGVFAAIPENGSISAIDLAKAVNATVPLIERPCRILVGVGFLDQAGPDGGNYSHTKFSLAWRDTNVPGPAAFYQSMYDVYLVPSVQVCGYLEDRKVNGLYSDPSSNWDSLVANAYSKPGEKQGSWQALANYPDITRTFAIGLKLCDALVQPTGIFDFNQLAGASDRTQLVDIAGGYGDVLTQILTAYPKLDPKKCVLQEIEAVVALTDAVKAKGVQTQVIDFFKEQPVKGAVAYFMRFITHDYSDPEAITILSHVAKAMAPDSRLLIADSVVPERLVEETLLAGIMDQLMFCIGGRERTEAGFRAILEPNGLELVTVHRSQTGGAIVEARLRPN